MVNLGLLESARDFALGQIERTLDEVGSAGDSFPWIVQSGQWTCTHRRGWEQSPGNWTAGFWPGILWRAYCWCGHKGFRDAALRCCRTLQDRLDWPFHDVGFLFHPSCGRGHGLTGEGWLRSAGLSAADTLVALFWEKPGMVALSSVREESFHVAIDTMMNLSLLWWAFTETGQQEYRDVAVLHARNTAKILLRGNGSTWHVGRLSSTTGELEWRGSWQGLGDDSCWSRGQAWAIAGYAEAWIESEQDEFKGTLGKLLGYWSGQRGWGSAPPWDFSAPEGAPADSSAAAVAAWGLLRSGVRDRRLWSGGIQILEGLIRECHDPGSPGGGILLHGCFHFPRGLGVDTSLIWGDYFFVEALDLALGFGGAGSLSGRARTK